MRPNNGRRRRRLFDSQLLYPVTDLVSVTDEACHVVPLADHGIEPLDGLAALLTGNHSNTGNAKFSGNLRRNIGALCRFSTGALTDWFLYRILFEANFFFVVCVSSFSVSLLLLICLLL